MDELTACQSRLASPALSLRSLLRRREYALPALLLLIAIVGAGSWFWSRSSRIQWARHEALPEIARLVDEDSYVAAFHLAREAARYIPGDPELVRLDGLASRQALIETTPAGADVHFRGYLDVDGRWESLGKSPIANLPVPAGLLRWKISSEGFDTFEAATTAGSSPRHFRLERQGTRPPGMVRVPGGSYRLMGADSIAFEEYWLDQYEVTNEAFKEFVDAGGYRDRKYWKHPFIKEGQVLTWEEATTLFRDATGRPGPSTWELGTYLDGQGKLPVGGVSWYEAAAYTVFAGKSLPTVHHWRRATGGFDQLRFSNFGGQGPVPVGSSQALERFGTYDMAGNVAEWCWNETGSERYILGGAWSEPIYSFNYPAALAPFDRSPTNGFRCAKYGAPPPEMLNRPIERFVRDFRLETPVDDDIFEVYKSFYSYDRTELNAAVEAVDERSERWRLEKITFDAAYGDERVIIHLYLPREADPPYQTVVYFPGTDAFYFTSFESYLDQKPLDGFLVRSGRAVLFPIYKGTYDRGGGHDFELVPFSERRDMVIQWSKDLARSIDYLETREDIDADKLAYFGVSLGAEMGPILTALDTRFKASVLLGGGFYPEKAPAEIDPLNFAPRAQVPVLMINGRHEFSYNLETSQRPMFRLLGAPQEDKRHALFDSGHVPPRNAYIKETLDWLDRYLGPVRAKRPE